MQAIKIRPNDQRAFTRQGRRNDAYHLPYHVRGNRTFYSSLPVNQRTLINIFGYLHSYAGHGVKVMRQRYKSAERRFEQRHMPYSWGRSTSRFVNKYTAHKWM